MRIFIVKYTIHIYLWQDSTVRISIPKRVDVASVPYLCPPRKWCIQIISDQQTTDNNGITHERRQGHTKQKIISKKVLIVGVEYSWVLRMTFLKTDVKYLLCFKDWNPVMYIRTFVLNISATKDYFVERLNLVKRLLVSTHELLHFIE